MNTNVSSRAQLISTPSGYARFIFPWPLTVQSYKYIEESLLIQLSALKEIANACDFIGPRKKDKTK